MKRSLFMLVCFRRRSFWSMVVRWASQDSNWRVALTTFMRATIAAGGMGSQMERKSFTTEDTEGHRVERKENVDPHCLDQRRAWVCLTGYTDLSQPLFGRS